MLADGALLIEWPERINGLVPAEHLWIDLGHRGEKEREMKFKAVGKRYEELLKIVRHADREGE
jgi:tRNA A37 threonylcarbamoyladenosine biosynthesis protein TsaE